MKPLKHRLPIDLAKYRANAPALDAWCLAEKIGYSVKYDPLAGRLPQLLFEDAALLARVESAWASILQ